MRTDAASIVCTLCCHGIGGCCCCNSGFAAHAVLTDVWDVTQVQEPDDDLIDAWNMGKMSCVGGDCFDGTHHGGGHSNGGMQPYDDYRHMNGDDNSVGALPCLLFCSKLCKAGVACIGNSPASLQAQHKGKGDRSAHTRVARIDAAASHLLEPCCDRR